MNSKNTYSPYDSLISKQLNLSDFGFEISIQKFVEKSKNWSKKDLEENKLINFIIFTNNYAKRCLNKYSNYFSKHLYSQPILFTILALKIYLKLTYRKICFLIDLSDKLKRFLGIKRAPHFTTLQKFFKRIPTADLRKINQLIINKNEIHPDIIALDGSGFTNDYVDKYYAKIRKKERKSYIKTISR